MLWFTSGFLLQSWRISTLNMIKNIVLSDQCCLYQYQYCNDDVFVHAL